ncbi:MAG: GldG family protein [Terrimicrobiaceae bacterium]
MKSQSLFSSLLWIVVVVIAVVAVNILAGVFRARIDLTQDRAFTLSEGTRRMLSNLEDPVQLRLYVSSGDSAMPPFLKTYVQQIEDVLNEMRRASDGKVEVIKLSPLPDSEAGDSARIDGIEPHPLPDGSSFYLGLSATQLDQKVTLPFLTPDRERLLEYDIARTIARVAHPEKPKIGIMSALAVMGKTGVAGFGAEATKPWALVDELQKDFDVEDVSMNATEIPEGLRALLVIHPKDISEVTQFAMDQFLLQGGRLVVFLDPYCILDAGPTSEPTASTLPKLLPSWGLTFSSGEVMADMDFEARSEKGRAPSLLDLTAAALNPADVITSGLDTLLLAFAGTFTVAEDPSRTVQHEVLVHTSKNSRRVDPGVSRTTPEEIRNHFEPSGKEWPLALRLTGIFSTAFPEGAPSGGRESSKEPLKSSVRESTVILVGDADMIHDQLAVTEVRGLFPGGRMFAPTNGNLLLAQGAMEQLAGDEDLIAVRSRAVKNRPFTVVKSMQARAGQKFQATINDLEASLEETRSRLTALEVGGTEGARATLSQPQQQEIAGFRAKEAGVKKELKAARRQLRAEIDALEIQLKWLNLAAVPALVAVVAIAFAVWRRGRSAAK